MPKFSPDAISIILLGPGVIVAEIANRNIDKINSIKNFGFVVASTAPGKIL